MKISTLLLLGVANIAVLFGLAKGIYAITGNEATTIICLIMAEVASFTGRAILLFETNRKE